MEDRQYVRDLDFAPEQGESFRQVLHRVAMFSRQLEERHNDDDILVVGHGGSLRALAVSLLGFPDEAFWKIRGLQPASISMILRDGGTAALASWNDTGHLG